MTRKEIYAALDEPLKYPFRIGELAYDRATEKGQHPLSPADAAKLTTEELEGIFIFQCELLAGYSDDIAAKDSTTVESCQQILECRGHLLDELADALLDAGDPDVGRIDLALAELDRIDPLPPGRSPEEALAEFKSRV